MADQQGSWIDGYWYPAWMSDERIRLWHNVIIRSMTTRSACRHRRTTSLGGLTMRIVVFKGKKGHWYFHVVARNNKIVAASEGYTSKRNAYKSIDLMRREMSDAEVEELE